MKRTEGLRISMLALLRWVLPVSVSLYLVGMVPTWFTAGGSGMLAQAVAAGIVLPVIMASGVVVVCMAEAGPHRAAFAFVVGGMVRVLVCTGLAVVAWRMMDLSAKPLFVWLGFFYVAGLMAEGVWVHRALKEDAHLLALGEIGRTSDLGPAARPGRDNGQEQNVADCQR